MIESKINRIKEEITQYAQLVDTMLKTTMDGALNKNWEEVTEVIDVMEPRANLLKLEIAQECLGILALFHPEASHLRSIIKMSGMASDLERMADMITKIALAAFHWKDSISLEDYPLVFDMAKETRKMLTDVIQAFMDENALAAVAVIQHDDRVDDLCTQHLKKLIKTMNEAAEVEPLLQIMNITRNLERMADLCTHLAEDVIFIKEGLVPNKAKK